jgi:hypothetical protein
VGITTLTRMSSGIRVGVARARTPSDPPDGGH